MPTFHAEALLDAATAVFTANGMRADDARLVAEHLVEADLCGVTSHGLLRLPQYVGAIEQGKLVPGAELAAESTRAAVVRCDGGQGAGQVMARRAWDLVLERARQHGAGVGTLTNCYHTGRLGDYTARAARAGFAALMMVNSGGQGQWVAPHGGITGRLATNPLSFAVPTGGEFDLVLDIATSAAPEGKIRAYAAAAQPIPEGWVIDAAGQPTRDPRDLHGPPRGALLPFGEHKGFGLALIVEALAGGLSGAGCCTDPHAPLESRTDGVFLFALDASALREPAAFFAEVQAMIRHVKSAATPPGGAIVVSGELEGKLRRARFEKGLELAPGIWAQIEPVFRRFRIEIQPSPSRS